MIALLTFTEDTQELQVAVFRWFNRKLKGVDPVIDKPAIPMFEPEKLRVFEPGIRYPEREVNVLLAVWHPDVAALRRYLVDEGFLTREAGVYWRSGGTVDIS